MSEDRRKYVYGPVPSRRLGRSLGIDLVPYKVCTYDCIYCQLGCTTDKTIQRAEHAPIDRVLAELDEVLNGNPGPDWVSLSGSGEPTIHSRIGELIGEIKSRTRIPVAVLTNGSLLFREDVRADLMEADLVLPSLDAGDEVMFRLVNRPHPDIGFLAMVEGLERFRASFDGQMWLEVMLLAGYTAIDSEVMKIASLCSRLRPDRVQLNTVMRPPAEEFAQACPPERINSFKGWFDPEPEVICEWKSESPEARPESRVTDDDILALLLRRPCSNRDVADGLGLNPGETVKRLDALVRQGRAVMKRNRNALFYEAARGEGERKPPALAGGASVTGQ